MYFRNYELGKTWLDKFLTTRVSEDPSTDNMANESKHCCNLNDSIFRMSINHFKGNSTGKNFFW